jgi:hypothetical protein
MCSLPTSETRFFTLFRGASAAREYDDDISFTTRQLQERWTRGSLRVDGARAVVDGSRHDLIRHR